MNKEWWKYKIGFIYTAAIGIIGFCFVDFGEHIVTDKNGEECKTYIKTYIIKKISNKSEIFIDRSGRNYKFNLT